MDGVIDVPYASLTSQGVEHRRPVQMVTHPDNNPVQQGLTSVFLFGASRTIICFMWQYCYLWMAKVSLLFLEESDDEDIWKR